MFFFFFLALVWKGGGKLLIMMMYRDFEAEVPWGFGCRTAHVTSPPPSHYPTCARECACISMFICIFIYICADVYIFVAFWRFPCSQYEEKLTACGAGKQNV
jgi:hypothetical protein